MVNGALSLRKPTRKECVSISARRDGGSREAGLDKSALALLARATTQSNAPREYVGLLSDSRRRRVFYEFRSPERFPAKACPGRDPGWIPVRVKKTRQNKNKK